MSNHPHSFDEHHNIKINGERVLVWDNTPRDRTIYVTEETYKIIKPYIEIIANVCCGNSGQFFKLSVFGAPGVRVEVLKSK